VAKNKYKGYCVKCQYVCWPGCGTRLKVDGEWAVQHERCPDVEAIRKEREEAVKAGRYEQQLRAEVLADPAARVWLSNRKRFV